MRVPETTKDEVILDIIRRGDNPHGSKCISKQGGNMQSHKLTEQERRIICAGGTAQLSKIYKSHKNRQLARFAQMRGLLIAPNLWPRFCEVYGFATEERPEPAPLFEEELGLEIRNGEAVKEYPESKEERKLAPRYPMNHTEALLGAILTEVQHIKELLEK